MGKKFEEKIKKEILKRVLEKDEFFAEKNAADPDMAATMEAIADITSLDDDEVKKIAGAVRDEMEGRRSIHRLIFAGVALALIIALGVAGYVWMSRPPKIAFTETFDTADRGWWTGEEFTYKRYIDTGDYVFSTNKKGWCYWDDMGIPFPDEFTVEVTTTWRKGAYGEYGLMLMEDDDNYFGFQLRGDGAAAYSIYANDTWKKSATWVQGRAAPGDGTAVNVQRIEVKGGRFDYYVNNRLFEQGQIGGLDLKRVGIRVCGSQRVDFNHVKVAAGGRVLLNESFMNNEAGWLPRTKRTRKGEIRDGRYLLSTGVADTCYWSAIPFSAPGDFDVELEAEHIKGEQGGYGLLIFYDEDDYAVFEMKSSGVARVVDVVEGKVTTNTPWKTVRTSDVQNTKDILALQVRDNRVRFLVNGKTVGSLDLPPGFMQRIGVRSCGRQTVGFDKLTITSP